MSRLNTVNFTRAARLVEVRLGDESHLLPTSDAEALASRLNTLLDVEMYVTVIPPKYNGDVVDVSMWDTLDRAADYLGPTQGDGAQVTEAGDGTWELGNAKILRLGIGSGAKVSHG